MNKRMREILNKIESLRNKAQSLMDEGNTADANAVLDEITLCQQRFEVERRLFESDSKMAQNQFEENKKTTSLAESASAMRALIKKTMGKALTDSENALVIPTTGDGDNGEGFLLPVDVSVKIERKLRDYSSLREVVGHMPVSALSGSYPVEDFETVTELADFSEDGSEISESGEPSFKKVSFKLNGKGAIIGLSNTLLSLSDENLIEYISEIFAKKAVVTENKMILSKLKENKTAKTFETFADLRKSINKDLDPASQNAAVILTNQTGFDFLDGLTDQNGRPMLMPNPSGGTKKLFKGYVVEVVSDKLMPSTAATATKPELTPIFFGNLKDSIKFCELQNGRNFALSEHAGFTKNLTYARVIEWIDCVQNDSSDKAYVFGNLVSAPKTGA